MIHYMYLLVLFLMFIFIRKKVGGISFTALSSLYVLLSYAVFLIVSELDVRKSFFHFSDVSFSAMPINDYSFIGFKVFLVFFLTMLVFVVGALKLSSGRNFELLRLTDLRVKFDSLGFVFKRYKPLLLFYALFILVLSICHLLSLDFDLLMLNYEYQTIKDPELIGITNEFIRFYHLSFRVFGLLTLLLSLYCLKARFYFISILLSISFIYVFILLLAGNSRWVFVYSAFSIFISILLFRNKTLTIISLVIAVFSLPKVMLGRGQAEQGLSEILDQIALVWDVGVFKIFFLSIYNLAEGGLNIANSFLITEQHTQLYKYLSFSPFPSFIDGFNEISETGSIRLHRYVPMSGISEIYSFGPGFVLFFYSILYFFIINIEKLRITKGVGIYIVFTVISLYSLSTLFSYSLRTTWKIMILVLFLSYFLNLFGKDRAYEKN
jgi:hypothetical protein